MPPILVVVFSRFVIDAHFTSSHEEFHHRPRVVAVHQPNFMPWLGYFDKIARADVFVFLDDVLIQKTGSSWTNRVRLLVNGAPIWFTAPIERDYAGYRRIREIRFAPDIPWRDKLRKTLRASYGKAPFFGEVYQAIDELLSCSSQYLADFNVRTITSLAQMIGIDTTKLKLGSMLNAEGHSTELLISITKKVGGTAYMCGGGAGEYQEDKKFPEAGLELIYQKFEHPIYQQVNSGPFVPGLSIIDCLMNCGFSGLRRALAA